MTIEGDCALVSGHALPASSSSLNQSWRREGRAASLELHHRTGFYPYLCRVGGLLCTDIDGDVHPSSPVRLSSMVQRPATCLPAMTGAWTATRAAA
jgi:hypothetical protein